MERLDLTVPEHPLPSEIRNMKRDETVCKFCGVSYLIHNEIKALEDKLRQTEEKLRHYVGCEEREARIVEELRKQQAAVEQYQQFIGQKDLLISKLRSDISGKDSIIISMNDEQKALEVKLLESVDATQQYRSKLQSCNSNISKLDSCYKTQRELVHLLRTDVVQQQQDFRHQSAQLQFAFSQLQKLYKNEIAVSEEKLLSCSQELAKVQKDNTDIAKSSEKVQVEMMRLRTEAEECDDLRNQCKTFQQRVTGLEKSLETELAKFQKVKFDSEQYKEQLSCKTKELDNIITQHRRVTSSLEQSINILQDKLKERESETQDLKMKTTKYHNELERQKLSEQEIQRRAAMTLGETEEMRSRLQAAEDELISLKSERESMILSHHTRIEQLKQSFINKMTEADEWPRKLEESLQKERSKNLAELSTVQQRLKDNYEMELQIEKQKQQELIDKYIENAKDEERKFKKQLAAMETGSRGEVNDLRKRLEENKKHNQVKEENLQKEITSLKSIIHDLENRLGRFDVVNEDQLQALKLSLKSREDEFSQLESEHRSLMSEYSSVKDEVALLQDTVRRECEERFELTAALSDVKEELLSFKRPSGGYSTPNRNMNGPGSRRGSGSTQSTIPHAPVASVKEPVGSSFKMDSESGIISLSSKVKGNSASMADSRKRIAAMLGRKQ